MATPSVEIVKSMPAPQDVFLPVMSIDVAVERRKTIIDFVSKIMVRDQDFGVIPGTGTKPVLLKPGAEKLCSFFGLEPEFTPITEEADWTGEQHGGEPFYYIRYRCRLMKNGIVMGVGEGSCNSWESKYRYRNANRKCPECQKEAIIKGKAEYGGGWLCFAKKGGCGAKFGDDDKAITGQEVGRVKNPDMADSVNTIQKMAQKRALVPATLLATSGSEFFTQDLEDSPEPPDHQRNTPEQQQELAQRRIEETRGDGPTGAAQSPTDAPSSNPAQAAPTVPEPLKALVRKIEAREAGAVRNAFDFLKAYLKQLSPEFGETEYRLIREKHNLVAGTSPKQCIVALIEMYERGEAMRAAAVDDTVAEGITDADLPRDLFQQEPK